MTFIIAVLLTILCSTSSAFQISTPISEVRPTSATASSTNTRSVPARLVKTRSAHDPLRHRSLFRDTSPLQTKKEEENVESRSSSDDDEGGGGETEELPLIRNRNVLDFISDSPIYTTFLLWAPIASNPRLRSRFTDFLSEYLDLRIAVPVFAVGSVGAFAYVAYERRLLDIELARDTTEESLRVVRDIRRAQMAGTGTTAVDDDGGGGGGGGIGKEFETALENYEYTLREELKLRNTFVMLPLKIPNAPEGPDRAAAKQFLGMEIDE